MSAALVAGPLLFARFAYPPNSLGYCGSADHQALLEYAASRTVDEGLVELAGGFAGAWPYLQLIAAASGITDPLDAAVVEAYWIGDPLLDRIEPGWLAASLDERFARRVGGDRDVMRDLAAAGGVPHHNFHVLCVSPWVGLLRAGHTAQPLAAMDRCRIRAGVVAECDGVTARVVTDRLSWDGTRLRLESPAEELVVTAADGYRLAPRPAPGDAIALHWGWMCDLLSPAQTQLLHSHTERALALINRAPTGRLERAVTS